MCHYAQLTFPVPAVIVVTLKAPSVAVDPVNPAPIVIVLPVAYRKITIPEPPEPPLRSLLVDAAAPPPDPVFTVPSTPLAAEPPP
jgi:hypothetical protein